MDREPTGLSIVVQHTCIDVRQVELGFTGTAAVDADRPATEAVQP